MPMINAIEAIDKFRKKFGTGKSKKENLSKSSRQLKSSKENSGKRTNEFGEYLNSELSKKAKNM